MEASHYRNNCTIHKIGNSGYTLIFVALTPHPSESVDQETKPEQSATLKLIKL